ncbi:MAG: hypothetical protein ACRC1G_09300 [Bradyrhizobium sp.]|nr:hypothetical protein [Bradyrhizobium sp.]
MRASILSREHHPVSTQWTPKKSTRLALLLGALLGVSAAVNGLIILTSAAP